MNQFMMDKPDRHIPEKPRPEYDPALAKKLLECARSYYVHADQLIYSYGSKTFLSGYDLFDPEHEMRGNIDCSTFIQLVLSGIPYEESPYAKGVADETSLVAADWADRELADFSNLPDRYVGIAERIGRPYLKGEKGLDLKKAEEMGISTETLAKEIQKTGIVRRSVFLAEYFLKKDACFLDPDSLRPGDIVFFLSKGYFMEGGRKFAGRQEINHVGIAAEDMRNMIHSSGTHRKGLPGNAGLKAVDCSPIFEKRTVAFFARYI